MERLVNNLPRGLPVNLPNRQTNPPVASPLPTPPSFDPTVGYSIIESISRLEVSHWFTVPLDLSMPLYTKRISSPIDFTMIKDKLQKRKYLQPEQFALDVRRTFANSLVYNFDVLHPELGANAIRQDAKTCLFKFEQEWHKIYEGNISPVRIVYQLSFTPC